MPVKCVEVAKSEIDTSRSHVRVERLVEGGFLCLGAISHPDVTEAIPIGDNIPVSRLEAIEAAKRLAERFRLPHFYVVEV